MIYRRTKGYRADLETLQMADKGHLNAMVRALNHETFVDSPEKRSNAPGLDEKLTDIIELLSLIADGSAHRGANEGRIREIKDKYGL